ncbi:MAG: 4Fe-4S binding protein [Methanosarcinales archaeon]|nr:4Fe-4S binding protein [Methanosarcinales archaeon]
MKFLLFVTPEIIARPLIAETVLETGALLNVDRADIKPSGGEIIIDVPRDKYDEVTAALIKRGAKIIPLEQPVIKDDEECINCGACISVCPTGVISFDEEWCVVMDVSKCIQCGLCITMCPHGALKVVKQNPR